jgi:hypothetical protein
MYRFMSALSESVTTSDGSRLPTLLIPLACLIIILAIFKFSRLRVILSAVFQHDFLRRTIVMRSNGGLWVYDEGPPEDPDGREGPDNKGGPPPSSPGGSSLPLEVEASVQIHDIDQGHERGH